MAYDQNQRQEFTSITGAWVLDLDRSDTFEDYLRCLGTPDAAIRAQVAAEQAYQSRHVISLDPVLLAMHKDTGVNKFTERFELNREHVNPRRGISGHVLDGVDQIIASLPEEGHLDGYLVATTTAGPSGIPTQESVEVRQLAHGGNTHTQQINARNLSTGEQCAFTRTWVRVPMSQGDQLRLAFF